jgi:hypothetical protein
MPLFPPAAPSAPAYRHRLLAPAAAQEVGHCARMLGIEVTVPDLAARCGLGNIDPQHHPDGGAHAAIEAALAWELPPPGATLATIRADADAAGAMAVLGLRAEGRVLSPAAIKRIAAIARHDRFDRGAWPGVRPVPPALSDLVSDLAAHGCAGLVAALAAQRQNLDACVVLARHWILTGRPGSRAAARAAAQRLLCALADGSLLIEPANRGRVAVATGAVPGALTLAYRLAPVVVGIEPDPDGGMRRMVVAQWREGHVDLRRTLAMLAAREPGWGGSPTIIGSPQGRICRSSSNEVLAILQASGV